MLDPLTGLFNRRHLEAQLAEPSAFYHRYGRPSCAVLLDLDDFKGINDSYGDRYEARSCAVAQAVRSAV